MLEKYNKKRAKEQMAEFIEDENLSKKSILSLLEELDKVNQDNINTTLLKKDEDNILYRLFTFLVKKKDVNLVELETWIQSLEPDTMKAAWAFEERQTDFFKLADAIKWVQEHFDAKQHSGAFVLKITNKKEKEILLKIGFFNLEDKPMTDMGDLYLKVATKSIDQDCTDAFGDKDMIIFK